MNGTGGTFKCKQNFGFQSMIWVHEKDITIKMEQGSSESNRPTPYDILLQQVAAAKLRDEDNIGNDSGYLRLNSSGEVSCRTDSASSLDTSVSSTASGDNLTSQPTSRSLLPFLPPSHSTPLDVGFPQMLVSMREAQRTLIGEQSCSVESRAKGRPVPSFLGLQSSPFPLSDPPNLQSLDQASTSHSLTRSDLKGGDYTMFLTSSASTPIGTSPGLSFPSSRRRRDSDSLPTGGSIFYQNLINCHLMQTLTEKLGANLVARAVGLDSNSGGDRPHFPHMLTNDLALQDLQCGTQSQQLDLPYVHPYVWSGRLPLRHQPRDAVYSCKVFLGGVPWDTDDLMLISAFQEFGNVTVEWPNRNNVACPAKGYVYIIFELERQVKSLLAECSRDPRNGGAYYYFVSSKKAKKKEVQVIPWIVTDANYIPRDLAFPHHHRLDIRRTIFVGALHGLMTAEALFQIMNEIFGDVTYAGVDTDKYKYPIGSGRVTFGSFDAFMRAVRMGFVEVRTTKFHKRLQIEPYLEDTTCYACHITQGPYFCRDLSCFRYYCRGCWIMEHPDGSHLARHKVITRTERNMIMRASVQRMF